MGQGKCPERIVGYTINGLVCGLVGGVIFVGANGILRGLKPEHTINNMRAVPYMGFQLGIVVAVYSTFDCLFKGMRGQDDRINVIASGAATGALFGAPRGPNSMAVNAMIGAFVALVCDQ